MRLRLLPVLCCGLLGSYRATAQTTPADSARVSYGEEVLAQPLRVDTVALRVQREDRDLWKLGLNNFTVSTGYQRYGAHLAYERKLGRPAWSALGEVSPSLLRHYRAYYPPSGSSYRTTFNVRAQLAGRYYYNLERRIRQGRNAGNFSANYLSLALGAGFGRFSDTPFSQDTYGRQFVSTELALLYGMQRRLGQHGFIDANAGLVKTLTNRQLYYNNNVFLGASLRVGLVLGGAPVARPYVPIITEGVLRPQWYVGVHAGIYDYGLQRARNFGFYDDGVLMGPYVYVGRYLRPRLAVQAGLQYGRYKTSGFSFPPGPPRYSYTATNYSMALPLLLRYSLTRAPQQRLQADLLAGAALVTVWSFYRQQEYDAAGQPLTLETGRDYVYGIDPMLGLNLAYGFGRTRRVQAVAEAMFIKPLINTYYRNTITAGVSLGLRYRFHYQ